MRITSKGQVTIPQQIREAAGMLPNTEVDFDFDGETVRIFRVDRPHRGTRGRDLVRHLQAFKTKFTMTTEEIMALTRGED